MKNNTLFTSINIKPVSHSPCKFVNNIFLYFITFCLFFVGSFLNTPLLSTANALELPYTFENSWAKYDDYIVLKLTLKTQEGHYTYAPNQKNVYPTTFMLYVNASNLRKSKKFPYCFLLG